MPKPEAVGMSDQMRLLPPANDACQECAVKHDPALPHDFTSLHFQVKFKMDNGRDATSDDAMAHCDEETKRRWRQSMIDCGVDPETWRKTRNG